VGFIPTIPASKRANTVHALDRSATVTGLRVALHLVNFTDIYVTGWDQFEIHLIKNEFIKHTRF
jgi:hypothetical protein